jgi:hypothetical protein
MIMNNRELTIEEIREECRIAEKNYRELKELLNDKVQEENDRKRKELSLKKEMRKQEVDYAFEKYIELSRAYERDYGPYIPWQLFWN